MPYKHPTDRQAYRRAYYQEHKEDLKEATSVWYEDNKGSDEYKLRKSKYMILYRRRKKLGL